MLHIQAVIKTNGKCEVADETSLSAFWRHIFQLLKRGNDIYLSWLDFLRAINKGISVAKCLSYSRNADCILRKGAGLQSLPSNTRGTAEVSPPRVENVLVDLFSHKTANSITADLM